MSDGQRRSSTRVAEPVRANIQTFKRSDVPAAGTSEVPASPQTAQDSAAEPSWRQPPAESRANIRRRQIAIQRIDAIPRNPSAPSRSRGVETSMAARGLRMAIARVLHLAAYMAWGQWLALILVVASAIAFSQLVTDQYFSVTEAGTVIRGNQRIPSEEIYRASGINQRNVFLIRPEIAARHITELPDVETAAVHVRLPANAVIDVTELSPLAIVQTITETLWVGSDGSRIEQIGAAPELTLVEVSGTTLDGNGSLRPIIAANLAVFRATRPEQTSLYYGALEGLYFRPPEGYTVYLGEEGSMAQKLALLEVTQRQLAARNARVRVIDLRFDGYALVK